MQGTVIHYDPLTRCGVLRAETDTPTPGQLHYFRDDEVINVGHITPGQRVTLRTSVATYATDAGNDANEPDVEFVEAVPVDHPGQFHDTVPRKPSALGNIAGFVLALLTLFCLLGAGGETGNFYTTPGPKLTESLFGVLSAVGLVIMMVHFFALSPRKNVRRTYWLVAISSLIAYISMSFRGFEADQAASAYGWGLLALGFAVYVLPFRPKQKHHR
ncbi:hypothetical protein J2I47_00465 [Fibrella sp. HMF5335]|uniref:Uncharacterized protein n=1 Tax=Fibrella rubiginis TaxID=2817060 RepID=A0A939K3D0_9BACT|nr:hypothetical protein [Fibrella rubiginis]MBO0935006.1 hypothetical protein [Fibrella rubiginis]